MPLMQTLKRTARGLWSQFNPINQIPEGGLLEAFDVVIDREGVISKRRGFKRYAGVKALSFMDFKNRLIALEGTTLKYDSDGLGTLLPWTGSFSPPDASTRMHFVEARKNLYFTTSRGIFKNSTLTGIPSKAGMPQALDIELVLTGTGASWFTPNTQVGYAVTWSKTDVNMFLIRGEPSFRETLANATTAVTLAFSAGVVTVTHTAHGYLTGDTVEISSPSDAAYGSGPHVITVTGANTYTYTVTGTPPATGTANAGKKFNVRVTFSVPDDIVDGDYYELYRSDLSANATTDPGERLFQILRRKVTASDIMNKTVTLTDDFDPLFLGEEIYTSPFVEGASEANTRPPFAKDIALFKGEVFFANTRREHFLKLQLIDPSPFDGGMTVMGFIDGIIQTSMGFTEILTTQRGSISIRSGTTVLTYNYGTAENAATRTFKAFTTELTLAENIKKTCQSLVRIVNRDSLNTLVYAFYASGVDDAPGNILFRGRSLDTPQFYITASTTAISDNWNPALPLTDSTVLSDNETKANNLARAKFEQPEAVPRSSDQPIDSEESEILRILALRDSLIIFKEEGIYRFSSDGQISELDPSTKLTCPESAVVLDNSVYCVTTQGVVRVNESGTAIVSRPVEADFKRVFGMQNFKTLVHAVAHESERKYIVWTPRESGSANTSVAWVYNYITEAWTKWRKKATAALVLFDNDALYVGHAVDSFVLEERRFGSTFEDYRDEAIDCTVTVAGFVTIGVDGITVSQVDIDWSYTEQPPAKGFLFEQGFLNSKVMVVISLGGTSYRLTLEKQLTGITTGAATLSLAIVSEVRWAPDAMGNAGVMKQFSYSQVYMEEDSARRHEIGFFSDILPTKAYVNDIVHPAFGGWGTDPWGSSSWGGSTLRAATPLRVPVPTQYQRARALSVLYRHRMANEKFEILQLTLTARAYSDKTATET